MRHRQQRQLGGDLVGQPGGARGPCRREPARGLGQLGAQLLLLAAQLLDPLVGAVEVEQAQRGLLTPGQHLVDRLAVLAGERGQRRAALGDHRQAGRVDVQPRGVRGDVGGEVGEQVGELGEPVGQLAGLRVVVADALEGGPRRRGRGQGVGLVELAGQRLAGLLGGGAQGVGEPEPGLLGGERGVLAGLRVDRLQLLEAEAEQVGLAGALPGARHHLVELALAGHQAGVPLGVRGQQRGGLLAAEPVEGLALRPGLQQAVLVGLPVHGDQGLGHAGQRGDRHGGAADEGAGAALGRDVAGQHHPAVLDLSPDLLDGGREPGQVADPDHALHPRAAGPRADGPAVGAAAEEQAERGHDHGLAGPGLTGDDGEARAELQGRGVDDAEGPDPDLLKHRGPRPADGGARWSRASPRRAARTSRPAGR